MVCFLCVLRKSRSRIKIGRVSTTQPRISKYNKGRPYHRAWLQEVLAMNPANLNKNTIGLDATQTKAMAKVILKDSDNWHIAPTNGGSY